MTSPFSFTSKTDGVDDHLAAHVNALQLAADVLAKSPDGTMFNGKLSVTVATNDITVAIKTLDGNDPSSSDPVYIVIGGVVRALTVALSVTKNDGTNWFNSGSTELATKEIDYFAYIIWNTTPATDILDIGFARIPYGRIYSDFSGTTTNEKYLANGNASAPNPANDCVVVGRFTAILGAGASYNWSVPAFTTSNLIQRPIYESRWLSYSGQVTAGSGSITTVGTVITSYQVDRMGFHYHHNITITTNGTGATSLRCTLPFTPAVSSQIGKGKEVVSTGNMLVITYSTNIATYVTYNNTYPGGDGRTIFGSGETVRIV